MTVPPQPIWYHEVVVRQSTPWEQDLARGAGPGARSRGLLALLVGFATAACGSGGGAGGNAGVLPDSASSNLGGSNTQGATSAEARVEAALRAVLSEPVLRYANVRQGVSGAICGEVETRTRDGGGSGLRPFLVRPEGDAAISPTPTIALEDPDDRFPDLYMAWCASPEELRAIQQRMSRVPLPPLPPEIPVAEPPEPSSEPVDVDARDPPRREPRPQPRPQEDDSFFNSVVRPPRNAPPP